MEPEKNNLKDRREKRHESETKLGIELGKNA